MAELAYLKIFKPVLNLIVIIAVQHAASDQHVAGVRLQKLVVLLQVDALGAIALCWPLAVKTRGVALDAHARRIQVILVEAPVRTEADSLPGHDFLQDMNRVLAAHTIVHVFRDGAVQAGVRALSARVDKLLLLEARIAGGLAPPHVREAHLRLQKAEAGVTGVALGAVVIARAHALGAAG